MTAQKGSAFLLKIGDGAPTPTYETVAGLRTTQMSINGDTVVVTHKESGGVGETCFPAPEHGLFQLVRQEYSWAAAQNPQSAIMHCRALSKTTSCPSKTAQGSKAGSSFSGSTTLAISMVSATTRCSSKAPDRSRLHDAQRQRPTGRKQYSHRRKEVRAPAQLLSAGCCGRRAGVASRDR